ncbi:autotransporter domain-containing protein [Succinivibrio dextrinosolvens]|uniref:autotransporter family protein n=1 Tax=Succinivibrio dextrinosolvens TaxID=83771 RepID=UPI0019207B19|nr:autotransporter domain-containing protein [Succinivibrio dextrinosolvens]
MKTEDRQTQLNKFNCIYNSECVSETSAYDNLSCTCNINNSGYSIYSNSRHIPSFYDPKSVNLSSGYGLDTVLLVSSGVSPDKWHLLSNVISRGGVILQNGGYLASTMMVACALQTIPETAVAQENVLIIDEGHQSISANVTLGTGYPYQVMNIYSGCITSGADAGKCIATSTTIKAGGTQNVYASGYAISSSIFNGGKLYVTNGGVTSNSKVLQGGNIYLETGGIATSTTVYSRGNLLVKQGGSLNAVTLAGGVLKLADDLNMSSDSGTGKTIQGHGEIGRYTDDTFSDLAPTSIGITLNNSHSIIVSGGALKVYNSITNNSGGGITVNSGGALYADGDITVNVGGTITVSAGGKLTANNIKAQNTATVSLSGGSISASNDIIMSAGLTNANGNVIAGNRLEIAGADESHEGELNLSAGQDIKTVGEITATNVKANRAISAATQSINAKNLYVGDNIEARDVNVKNGSIYIGNGGELSGELSTRNTSGYVVNISAASATLTGSIISAGSISTSNGATINASKLSVSDLISGGLSINQNGHVTVGNNISGGTFSINSGTLTVGSTDASAAQDAMKATGASAVLNLAKPIEITGGTGIKIGTNADAPDDGGLSIGTKAALTISVEDITESNSPAVKANSVKLSTGSILSLNGISKSQTINVFETANISGSLSKVSTDNIAFSGSLNADGSVDLEWRSASEYLPGLSPSLVRILNNAVANAQIGTGKYQINSESGGIRFLSRILSTSYGGANPTEAASTIESVARAPAAAAVPSMTISTVNASTNAVAQRLGSTSTGNGQLYAALNYTVSDNDYKAIPDKELGYAIWAMPLFQRYSAKGLDCGGQELKQHSTITGLALGIDKTFENAIRTGVSFNIGLGESKSKGDLNRTSNDMDFWGITLYGGWMADELNLTTDLSYAHTLNDIKQDMPSSMQMERLTGKVSSWSLSYGTNAAYTFHQREFDITPHAGFRFTHVNVNNYTIKSGSYSVLEGQKGHQNIWSFPLGTTLSKKYQSKSSWYYKPFFDAHLTYNAGDLSYQNNIRFTGTDGYGSVSSKTVDRVYYGFGTGIELGKDRLKLNFNYNFDKSTHTYQHTVIGYLNYKF